MNKPLKAARDLAADTLSKLPMRRGPVPWAPLGWFAAGAIVGSAAMYLLDPEAGARRRSGIRSRSRAWKDEAARFAEAKARTWKESAQHLWSKALGTADHDSEVASTEKKTESYLH